MKNIQKIFAKYFDRRRKASIQHKSVCTMTSQATVKPIQNCSYFKAETFCSSFLTMYPLQDARVFLFLCIGVESCVRESIHIWCSSTSNKSCIVIFGTLLGREVDSNRLTTNLIRNNIHVKQCSRDMSYLRSWNSLQSLHTSTNTTCTVYAHS